MFVLDQNHSELTERHTRQRFRRRGGLHENGATSTRLSQTAITAVRKDTAAHVSLPSQLVKEQRHIRRCANLPKQHDGTEIGASLLIFREVLQDKAAATAALSMELNLSSPDFDVNTRSEKTSFHPAGIPIHPQ
jgi:hypothetical protein